MIAMIWRPAAGAIVSSISSRKRIRSWLLGVVEVIACVSPVCTRNAANRFIPSQEAHLVKLYRDGEHTVGQLAELFSIARSTVYRAIERYEMAATVVLEPVRS